MHFIVHDWKSPTPSLYNRLYQKRWILRNKASWVCEEQNLNNSYNSITISTIYNCTHLFEKNYISLKRDILSVSV